MVERKKQQSEEQTLTILRMIDRPWMIEVRMRPPGSDSEGFSLVRCEIQVALSTETLFTLVSIYGSMDTKIVLVEQAGLQHKHITT